MIRLLYFLPFLYLFPCISYGHGGEEPERRTLVISLDAFRWDYVDRIRDLKGEKNSHIWRLIRGGAFARNGVTSAFTTITFPNHYTMVTGLYEESHGIVSNVFYDPVVNKTADLKNGGDKWAYGGEPIWRTLLKQSHTRINDGAVGCVMWISCQFGGFKNFLPYNESLPWNDRVDLAIHWLTHDSAKLVLMYYHEPDKTGHIYGPDSKEMNQTLVSLDDMIGSMVKKLEENGLMDEINLLIVSDHGMSPISANILPEKIPEDMFHVWSKEPASWLVEPLPGRHNDTVNYFNQFPHLSVYEKPSIPDRLHYKHNDRIPSLLLLADPGYTMRSGLKGAHGFDNNVADMRPTMIAHGPAFIANSIIPEDMETVDVYLLLCTILNLIPAPNNGTQKHFRDFLRPIYHVPVEGIYGRITVVTMAVSVSVSLFALFACACHWQRTSVHRSKLAHGRPSQGGNGYMYRPLNLESIGPLLTTGSDDFDFEDSDGYEEHGKSPKRP